MERDLKIPLRLIYKALKVSLEESLRKAVVVPRFVVDEGWKWKGGQWRRKVRLIDDFSASRVNEAVFVGEKISHDTIDVVVGLDSLCLDFVVTMAPKHKEMNMNSTM